MAGSAARVGAATPNWKAVEQALGKFGELQEGDVFRVGIPRTDLSVTVKGVPVKAGFALDSDAAFKHAGDDPMVRGDRLEPDGCRVDRSGRSDDQIRSTMSRHAMEQALGKRVMDVGFRDAFFRDPRAASLAAGLQLTDHERSALGRIRPGALAAFQRYLDEKRVGNWVDDVSA